MIKDGGTTTGRYARSVAKSHPGDIDRYFAPRRSFGSTGPAQALGL
jgi:hypothetical protein